MSHTNSTTNYGLPQFVTTDKPFWLTDVNQAYSDIDAAMKNNADAASTAGSNDIPALSDASAAATTASVADAKAAGAIASISDQFDTTSTYNVGDIVIYNNLLYKCTTAVTTPGAWTGSTNWSRITIESIIDDAVATLNTKINALTLQVGDSYSAIVDKIVTGRMYNDGSQVICFYPLDRPIAGNSNGVRIALANNCNIFSDGDHVATVAAGTYTGFVTDGGISITFTLSSPVSAIGANAVAVQLTNRNVTIF